MNEPGPPDDANGGDAAGSTETVHVGGGGAAASWLTVCEAVAFPLVTTSVVVRADVAVCAATVYETDALPVPLVAPVTVAKPPPPETDHWHVGPVTTLN